MKDSVKASVKKYHRLLVGEGRYIVLEKRFAGLSELRDWIAVNTVLGDDSISLLLTKGEISFGTGNKQEWFRYLPPPQ